MENKEPSTQNDTTGQMESTVDSTTKLNVELLRKIQAHITEEPRRFFMGWFVATGDPGKALSPIRGFIPDEILYDLPDTAPACGTAACIAGWANILSGLSPKQSEDSRAAANFLRLPEKDEDYTYLFSADDWPEPFAGEYAMARTPELRAKIACARIDHLIATGE